MKRACKIFTSKSIINPDSYRERVTYYTIKNKQFNSIVSLYSIAFKERYEIILSIKALNK
jgi:hypothetical protein